MYLWMLINLGIISLLEKLVSIFIPVDSDWVHGHVSFSVGFWPHGGQGKEGWCLCGSGSELH